MNDENGEKNKNGECGENNKNDKIKPKLYLCATPIGNMGDITLRTLDTLKNVERVYCEDTRNALKLLNHFGIKKPTVSCHEHNEARRAEEIASLVSEGKAIAFVSDAGMPAVSDPGARLISCFIQKGLPFEVLPGANAAITAWALSGLPTDSLYFCGFLPRSGRERERAIEKLKSEASTSVLYESPLRVGATLSELYKSLGERPCALVREITKLYEQTVRGELSELAEKYSNEPPKGECVIVLGGASSEKDIDNAKLHNFISALLTDGVSVKKIAKLAADIFNIAKNDAYRLACEQKEKAREQKGSKLSVENG